MDRRTADFWNTADNAAAEYTQLILERKEYGMISPVQGPFWNHQPYPVKVIPDALCFPVRTHTMSSTDLAIAHAIDDSLSRTHLRAEIDCNSPTRTRTEVQSFQWSRNTASGGAYIRSISIATRPAVVTCLLACMCSIPSRVNGSS